MIATKIAKLTRLVIKAAHGNPWPSPAGAASAGSAKSRTPQPTSAATLTVFGALNFILSASRELALDLSVRETLINKSSWRDCVSLARKNLCDHRIGQTLGTLLDIGA